jgi:hypothetical protein
MTSVIAPFRSIGKGAGDFLHVGDHRAAHALHRLDTFRARAAVPFEAIVNPDFGGELGPVGVDDFGLERSSQGDARHRIGKDEVIGLGPGCRPPGTRQPQQSDGAPLRRQPPQRHCHQQRGSPGRDGGHDRSRTNDVVQIERLDLRGRLHDQLAAQQRRPCLRVVLALVQELDRAGQSIPQLRKAALDAQGQVDVAEFSPQRRAQIAQGHPGGDGQHGDRADRADAGVLEMDQVIDQAQQHDRADHAAQQPAGGMQQHKAAHAAADGSELQLQGMRH